MMRSIPGEIVEVQGGHIVRSMGGKDRHSKVCTAKGPRDRRVRLSAHTAIQFYDVQDRLGYDRPSKAVDWLINNAKAAIDELAELPAWHPTALSSNNPPPPPQQEAVQGESSKKPMLDTEAAGSSHNYSFIGGGGGINGNSGFLPPSLDSDAIADTIKSFFPIAAATSPSSSRQPLGYQNYLPHLLSRTSSQNQDLRLSLHSFQDPIYHQQQQQQQQNPTPTGHHAIFSGYDSTAISMPQWNVAEASGSGDSHGGGGGGGRFAFNVPPPQAPQALPLHPMLGQGQFFTQREPLQSSTPPFVRAWVDPMVAAENPMYTMFHPSVQSIGFVSGSSGFSSFRIPARIQGEEEHDGISDKPSSTSSGSHH